jgi:hypothetical protein
MRGPTRTEPGVKNTYETEMDAALKAQPPVIVWRTNRKGIQVAVKVQDPHAERSIEAQADRLRASAAHAERGLIEEEAYEVAERFRKHRADNSPLMAAARRAI